MVLSQDGLNFLGLSASAEALASGNSYWGSSLYTPQEFIPSELSAKLEGHIAFTNQNVIQDISSKNIFFSSKMMGFGFGLYYKYFGIDNIEERNSPSSEPIGTFKNYNSAVGLSISKNVIENVYLGATYKLITEKNNTLISEGSALDLSMSYHLNDFIFYSSLINVSHSLDKLNTTVSNIPKVNVIGVSASLSKINMGLEHKDYHNSKSMTNIYSSFAVNEWFTMFSGYVLNSKTDSWSFGARFLFKPFSISYGYAKHEYLDQITSIQVGIIL